jgi:hypothetical protein
MIRERHRATSFGLIVALLLWAQMLPAANVSPTQMHACQAHEMHMQASHMAGAMHSCCPRPVAARTAKPACQQDCCKVGRQPAPRVPYLASSNKPPSIAKATSTEGTISSAVQSDRLIRTLLPVTTKAIFDLKGDLRV